MLAAAAAAGLLHTGWFEARHRQLNGAGSAEAAGVWRAAGISSATPLLDIAPATAARRVERLAWVRTADVRLHWPDTVVLTVTRRVAVAVVGSGSGAEVVDRSGRALALASADPAAATLPTVATGAVPVPLGRWVSPAAAPALAVAGGVPPILAGRVSQVSVVAGQVGLALTGGVAVVFGPPAAVQAKFESLAAVLADPVSAPSGPAVIDVTDPRNPTVGPPGPA